MSKENLAELRTHLSESKQALLQKLLRGKNRRLDRLPTIPRRPDRSQYPLSFSQQRLWFTEQMSGSSPLYVIPSAVRIEGALDLDALEQVLNIVMRRHEILRTSFFAEDGEPVQRVSESVHLGIRLCDASKTQDPDAEASRLVERTALRSLSLSCPPLIAADMIRISDSRQLLLLRMHHIIADEWSLGVLLGEIAELYQSILKGDRVTLRDLDIQYADFAVWEREWVDGPECAAHVDYWKSKLFSLPPPLDLPPDYARPPITEFKGGSEPVFIPPNLTKAVRALAEAQSATLFMSLLTAFSTLIFRYTGREDFVIGSPVAGRTRRELSNLMGCFVNMLPLRLNTDRAASFARVLAGVRTTALEGYTHQD
ncbi:MAG: condensation domain-containing protein, partial [Blastocatellia bacterium]